MLCACCLWYTRIHSVILDRSPHSSCARLQRPRRSMSVDQRLAEQSVLTNPQLCPQGGCRLSPSPGRWSGICVNGSRCACERASDDRSALDDVSRPRSRVSFRVRAGVRVRASISVLCAGGEAQETARALGGRGSFALDVGPQYVRARGSWLAFASLR